MPAAVARIQRRRQMCIRDRYYYDGFSEESDLNRKDDAVDAKIVEDVLKEFLC